MCKTIIAICGKTATGKSTVAKYTLARLQSQFNDIYEVVTCTTRPPREGEKNGVDYHFMNKINFEKDIAANRFIEYTNFRGWYYGTPLSAFNEDGIYILVVNAAGLKALQEYRNDFDIIPVYLRESFETRIQRSCAREGKFKIEYLRRTLADFFDFLFIRKILREYDNYLLFPLGSSIQMEVNGIIQYLVLKGLIPYQKGGQSIIKFDFQKSYIIAEK